MPANADLATIFDEMAAILEITGANAFRVNAHARVARALRDLAEDVSTHVDEPKALEGIEGIGKSSARKIIDFLKTGEVPEHQKLLETVPRGLLDVLRIPGLGPKTVRLLWEKGGVTDMDSLNAALESGALEDLPRMGQKTLQNIRDSLQFVERSSERVRLGKAHPIAQSIVEHLRTVDPKAHVEYAGSLRRGRETIGDIDILASTADPGRLAEAFRDMPGITKVLVGGDTKSSIRLELGMQVDLRIVPEASFGAALMYFTGSKAHNIVLRERAIKAGMRLNEYGLFPHDDEDSPPQNRGVDPVASETEEAIYAALDLAWYPPEMREDRGELAAQPPTLITIDDIHAELHAHTTASDGRLSIDELAAEAMARGYDVLAITDHSKSSAQAGGLSEEDLLVHVAAIREADARIDGIKLLAGSEVDILADGHLDYEDDILAQLDIVVASPHVALRQDQQRATDRICAAIRNPHVHIIGHPTGRVLGKRDGLPLDIATVVKTALEHDTALEINANSMRLDLRDAHVRAAVDAGVKIAINTDAHGVDHFDQLPYGILTARRGWLTPDGCINAWPTDRLLEWLAAK